MRGRAYLDKSKQKQRALTILNSRRKDITRNKLKRGTTAGQSVKVNDANIQ